jgi:hypothetical protein
VAEVVKITVNRTAPRVVAINIVPQLPVITKIVVTRGGSGGGVWGDLTGTLADQMDLQAALDGKAAALGLDDNYVTDAEKTKLSNLSGTNSGDQDLSGYYLILANGSNIKTINGNSLLGSGNIVTSTESEIRHDFQAPYDYLGKAVSGSSESSNVWTITRLTIASDGSTVLQSAINVSWNNRYSVIYT